MTLEDIVTVMEFFCIKKLNYGTFLIIDTSVVSVLLTIAHCDLQMDNSIHRELLLF